MVITAREGSEDKGPHRLIISPSALSGCYIGYIRSISYNERRIRDFKGKRVVRFY